MEKEERERREKDRDSGRNVLLSCLDYKLAAFLVCCGFTNALLCQFKLKAL